jgi:hypothetical protein
MFSNDNLDAMRAKMDYANAMREAEQRGFRQAHASVNAEAHQAAQGILWRSLTTKRYERYQQAGCKARHPFFHKGPAINVCEHCSMPEVFNQ